MKYIKEYNEYDDLHKYLMEPLKNYMYKDTQWWIEILNDLISTYYENDEVLDNILYLLEIQNDTNSITPKLKLYYNESPDSEDANLEVGDSYSLSAKYDYDSEILDCYISKTVTTYTPEYGYDMVPISDTIKYNDIVNFSDLLDSLSDAFIKMFSIK